MHTPKRCVLSSIPIDKLFRFYKKFKGTIDEAQFKVDEEDFELFDFLAEPQQHVTPNQQLIQNVLD